FVFKHRLEGSAKLALETRTSADEDSRHLPFPVNYDSLGDRNHLVLIRDGSVTVERGVQGKPLSFQARGHLFCRLLEIDRDKLHMLFLESGGGTRDLRHRLHTRATPGRPEIEHNDLSLGVSQVEALASHELELKIRRTLADQGRLRSTARLALVLVTRRHEL